MSYFEYVLSHDVASGVFFVELYVFDFFICKYKHLRCNPKIKVSYFEILDTSVLFQQNMASVMKNKQIQF